MCVCDTNLKKERQRERENIKGHTVSVFIKYSNLTNQNQKYLKNKKIKTILPCILYFSTECAKALF